jgi:hypothetical protein
MIRTFGLPLLTRRLTREEVAEAISSEIFSTRTDRPAQPNTTGSRRGRVDKTSALCSRSSDRSGSKAAANLPALLRWDKEPFSDEIHLCLGNKNRILWHWRRTKRRHAKRILHKTNLTLDFDAGGPSGGHNRADLERRLSRSDRNAIENFWSTMTRRMTEITRAALRCAIDPLVRYGTIGTPPLKIFQKSDMANWQISGRLGRTSGKLAGRNLFPPRRFSYHTRLSRFNGTARQPSHLACTNPQPA